jgi:predicted TIM-barrel fold metal-dependent hydrolase
VVTATRAALVKTPTQWRWSGHGKYLEKEKRELIVIGTDYGHGDTSSELNAISRFKAMESLNPQVKPKILSDNPRRFYGI